MTDAETNSSSPVELQKLADAQRNADRDFTLREQELALKRKESEFREREISLKEKDQQFARWLNPLFLALVAATATLIGNILVTHEQTKAALRQEQTRNEGILAQTRFKAQSDLILEAIKTGDPAKAATNLDFFVKLGFIQDGDHKIAQYLASKNDIPVLPPAAGVFPSSDARMFKPVQSLTGERLAFSKSVGQLRGISNDGAETSCTAWVVAPETIITTDYCVPGGSFASMSFSLGNGFSNGAPVMRIDSKLEENKRIGFALFTVHDLARYGAIPLPVSSASAAVGEQLFVIHFPNGGPEMISEDAKDCKVLAVHTDGHNQFQHSCATLGGSSGAPIFSASTMTVVGLHRGKIEKANGLVNIGGDISSIWKESQALRSR